MARTNKRKQQQQQKAATTPKTAPKKSRRDVMTWAGFGVLGLGVVGGGAAWAVTSYTKSVEERDLSQIGQGTPTIVQIHDPQCPICNALQRETRKALGNMDGEQPVYLVADLTQTSGAVFAQVQSVQHVTLLLFDAEGNRVQTLTGSRTRDELLPEFERLMSAGS